jgi:protein-L-isoaspartate(D-aspartate) O-methyltransferase
MEGRQLQDAKRRLLERLRNDVGDQRVIGAMERVPREKFVPDSTSIAAYEDVPLPIGDGQTISQPYIVAMMVSALELRRTDSVLEIGTGSGYQAAVLAELAAQVRSIERIAALAEKARDRLASLGYDIVVVHEAAVELGWPAESPYDAIVVAAGAPKIPRELVSQLVVGGRLVIPVGSKRAQDLMKITRTADGFAVRTLVSCRFVPLIGKGAWPDGNDYETDGGPTQTSGPPTSDDGP